MEDDSRNGMTASKNICASCCVHPNSCPTLDSIANAQGTPCRLFDSKTPVMLSIRCLVSVPPMNRMAGTFRASGVARTV